MLLNIICNFVLFLLLFYLLFYFSFYFSAAKEKIYSTSLDIFSQLIIYTAISELVFSCFGFPSLTLPITPLWKHGTFFYVIPHNTSINILQNICWKYNHK